MKTLQCLHFLSITVKTLQGDEEMKTLQCFHFLSITHGLIILLFSIPKGLDWFLHVLDFISYSFLFKSVAVSKPGYPHNNCLFRAIPLNIDLKKSYCSVNIK